MSHDRCAWGSGLPADSVAHRVAAPRNPSRTCHRKYAWARDGHATSIAMKIFGHPMSTCTRKVLMTLAETNTPYEFELVDFTKGEHKLPPHLARQPFGVVPALKDDDFELYESRAICRYINEKAGGSLIPSEIHDRARMEQWISIETSNFTGPAMKFIYHHVFHRPQTPETIATATEQLNTALTITEKQLAARPFLAGSTFSLADICFMPYIEYSMKTPAKDVFAKYPHVMAWWNKLSEKPSWQKIVA
jgi:glutathione S-transferase